MTLTVATFLAGSLLSMLMPVLLLIALAYLIFRAVQRVPGGDASEARRATRAEHAAPAAVSHSELSQPTGDPPVREV
jgi:hypothetical protein